MDKMEAAEFAMVLAAAFPSSRIQDGTLEWWTEDFVREESDVIGEVVERLAKHFDWPPSVRAVREVIRAVKGIHPNVAPGQPALPPGKGIPMPAEVRERMSRLRKRLDEGNEGDPEPHDPDPIEAFRRFAPDTLPRHPLSGECSGKPARRIGSHLVCSDGHCHGQHCPARCPGPSDEEASVATG